MQTVLGATGQIAMELARELRRTYTDDKYKQRFPDFKVTTYRQGLTRILADSGRS